MAAGAEVGEVSVAAEAGRAVTPARGAVVHAPPAARAPPSRPARAAEGGVGAVRETRRPVVARAAAARVQAVLLNLNHHHHNTGGDNQPVAASLSDRSLHLIN